MLFVLGVLIFLAVIYGPSLWCRWVITKYQTDRPDFPGTGGDLARHLLDGFGLDDVVVEKSDIGDHYDPKDRAVRLGAQHLDGRSLAAVAIAAHEVGHAIQHRDDYAPLKRRHDLIFLTQDIVRAGVIISMGAPFLGLLTRSPGLFMLFLGLGILTMAIQVVIHLITLPVEFDASFSRALPILERGGYLSSRDLPAARRLLQAAALTYVAASLSTLFNLWRWIRVLF